MSDTELLPKPKREPEPEAGNGGYPAEMVSVTASGVQAAASGSDVKSPETYLGYNRIENFISPGGVVQDKVD
jgi:hypothetical protein